MKKRGKSKDQPLGVRQILAILRKWGIHTLGQFASLDKDDLNARLGPEAVHLWERANGQSTRLLKLVQPPESFAESFEFEHDVETIEPLLFMLRRFLQQIALRLDSIYLVAKELTLRITFAGQRNYERSFQIPQPANDVDLLFRILHTHLENFKSKQPIIAVSLEAQPIKPAWQQFGLFETALRDPNRLDETLARLSALLGSDRVGKPVLEETFRPDAFHLDPFDGGTTSVSSHDSSDATERVPPRLSLAALRRFRPAPATLVFTNENEPAHVRSAEVTGKVAAQAGPYATSGEWWDEKRWSRVEWDVQLENGIVARCHQTENGWAVDGVYD